jgi:PASTA domain
MTAAATGLLLDPLAEDPTQLPAGLESRKQASAKHSETIAPELEGLQAGAAVSTVRALGLIAAIESLHVNDPGQHGLVSEQYPPPGTRLSREGVVVLRVGQPAEESPNADEPIGEQAPFGERDDRVEDDTRAWFATLVQSPGGPPPYSENPNRETGPRELDIADTQPLPTAPVNSPAVATATRWRRAGLLGTSVVAGAATVGALAIHTQGRPSASHVPRPRTYSPAPIDSAAPASRLRVLARPRLRETPRRHVRPTAGFRPAAATGTVPSLPAAETAPEADVNQPRPAAPTRISSAPRTSQPAGQFSYLGQ